MQFYCGMKLYNYYWDENIVERVQSFWFYLAETLQIVELYKVWFLLILLSKGCTSKGSKTLEHCLGESWFNEVAFKFEKLQIYLKESYTIYTPKWWRLWKPALGTRISFSTFFCFSRLTFSRGKNTYKWRGWGALDEENVADVTTWKRFLYKSRRLISSH